MTNKEIQALINLLDDPDEEVFSLVSENLSGQGEEAIPQLEIAWENTMDEILQERIESIIQSIHFNSTITNILTWINSGAEDILEGCYYVAKYQYPDLLLDEIIEPIQAIKRDVWIEMHKNLTALEKVKVLNHVIFGIHKFTKNTANFYAPHNSYINQVIKTKKGNPISLAIIYYAVAQKSGIPIYGVNLPKNFILAYMDELHHGTPQENVLFYVNPFNKGAVLGRKEIDYFIEQQKLNPQRTFYEPCNNVDIIKRLLLNLILSYERLGYEGKIKQLESILKEIK